jgi:hypothetical protein
VLAKPLTYMNLSGTTVRELCDFYKIESSDLIIVSDDIDLAPGQIRIRKTGSAGGHNGLKDIIQKMGTQDFIRVRVGTGAKPQNWDLADYVLGHFSKSDRKLIDEAVIRAAEAVECIASEGADAAMNKYNVRPARKRAEHRNIQADTAKNDTVQADTAAPYRQTLRRTALYRQTLQRTAPYRQNQRSARRPRIRRLKVNEDISGTSLGTCGIPFPSGKN